ncbi:hypothetical protein I0C86_28395 [Plantactinospora sp. S1510]|uniref:Uncharacterized protein n=1 Tax=Plantactinospora alkalitolerans TaxID=2789879 RepID=A0ABS0H3Q5_9ACTN|nr:hypothetical protein [Plantactinospora alkalitolerans]MBF9132848.1 hypothetical protein [Plantactinospora alkalitolerans]
MFLAKLRTLVEARPKPTWQMVLAADAADPNSRDALKLAEIAARTWQQLRPELLTLPDRRLPLLLFDAAPLARYGAMEMLEDLADLARGGVAALPDAGPVAASPARRHGGAGGPGRVGAAAGRLGGNEHRHGRPPQ